MTEPSPMHITIPRALSPSDLAQVLGVSLKVAQREFRLKPTFRVGRRRRMTWETVKKHYFSKEA